MATRKSTEAQTCAIPAHTGHLTANVGGLGTPAAPTPSAPFSEAGEKPRAILDRYRTEPADRLLRLPPQSVIRFAEIAQRASHGIVTVLRIIADAEVRRDDDEPALMNPWDLDALRGLAETSAMLLAEEGEHLVTWAEKYHSLPKEGGAA